MVYLFKGKLPWEKIDDYKKILRVKENITPYKLCKDLPSEFKFIYCYIKNLEFKENPDYNTIRMLLKNVILSDEKKNNNDFKKFIWEKQIRDMAKLSNNKEVNKRMIKEKLFPEYPINLEKLIEILCLKK